jgi:hypothetical protein
MAACVHRLIVTDVATTLYCRLVAGAFPMVAKATKRARRVLPLSESQAVPSFFSLDKRLSLGTRYLAHMTIDEILWLGHLYLVYALCLV